MAFVGKTDPVGVYDVVVNNKGFMLAQELDAAGNETGKKLWKSERMQFSPGGPTPEAQPFTIEPNFELAQVYATWRSGIGWREQSVDPTRDVNGIRYGRYMDKAGEFLGPSAAVTAFTPVTTDAVNGGNQFAEFVVNNVATPTIPILSNTSSGGTVLHGTYQVVVTYTNANGETIASPSASTTTSSTSTNTIKVTSPIASTGATGYYAYFTQAAGSVYTRQQAAGSPTLIGTDFTLTAPPTSTGAQPSTNINSTGGRVLICAMGRYLLYRASDVSWTIVKDFGLGAVITGITPFRGQQTVTYLYIAWQIGNIDQPYWVWDGTTSSTTLTQDANSNTAADFATYRDEIWMLNQDSNGRWQVQKATDGGTNTTWGGGFVVADGSQVCTHLVVNQDRLFIRSTLGLIGVNASENDAQMITGNMFISQFQNMNSCRPVVFGEFTIFQTSSAWLAYNAQDGTLHEVGLGTLKNNDSQVATGFTTTAASYRNWTVYFWAWNAANSTAYLFRLGEWEHIDTLYHPVALFEIVMVVHGALYEQPDKQVNGSIVSEIGGTTPRLYWCDAGGVISFMPLSRFSANPYTDASVGFNTTNPTEVYLPGITAHNAVEQKANLGIALVQENVTGANFWTASYRTDPAGVFGGSANLDNGGTYKVGPAQRDDWSNPPVSSWLDVKLTCTNTSSSAPPLVRQVVCYQALRPIFHWVHTFVVKVGSRTHSKVGSDISRYHNVTDDMLFWQALASTNTAVNVVRPDGVTSSCIITKITAEITRQEPGEQPEYALTVEAMEHKILSTLGSYLRLEQYTYAQLEQLTYSQMESL